MFQRRPASFHGCTGRLSNQQVQAEVGYQAASNLWNMAFPSINVSDSPPSGEVLNCSVTTLTSMKKVDLFGTQQIVHSGEGW